MKTASIRNLTLPILSALLLALAFPKYDFWILAWVGLTPLLYLLQSSTLKQIFLCCWSAGTLFFLLTINWIMETMNSFGSIPIWLSFLILLLLALYLGLFFAVFGILTGWVVSRARIPLPIAAPLLWVSLEYVRSHLLTGFPWASLGYSQYKFLGIIQIADITSFLGISFLIVGVNASLVEIYMYVRNRHLKMPFISIASVFIIILLTVATLFYGHYKLHASSDKDASRLSVAVLQGNIPQDLKWDRNFQQRTMNIYKELTEDAAKYPAQLVIWPETAAPFFIQDPSDYRRELIDFAVKNNIYLLVGSPSYRVAPQSPPKLYNSAYLISPYGKNLPRYDKIHLVPFGEYVPLSKVLFFIEKMVTGIGDFESGNKYTVFQTAQGKFGVVICFEVIFPDLVRRFVRNGAEFMTTITNDAWFGRSSAPYQHFSMTVFRAVENRVFFARAANTGISGFISPKGEILEASRIFEKGYLVHDISMSTEKSFYTLHGDIFACISMALTGLMLAWTAWKGFVKHR